MKTWSAIVSLLGVLMLFFLLLVFFKVDTMMERDFENIRLRYAVDYASAAAFQSTLEVEDIALDYTDLGAVKINPVTCLDVFKSMMCLSYDMSISPENFALFEDYIPTAVLATNDGYYISSMQEVDTTPADGASGGEYKLVWSIKKPYAIKRGNILYAVTLHDNSWTSVTDNGTSIFIDQGDEWENGITRDEIQKVVNKTITNDINHTVRERNLVSSKIGLDHLFYSPSDMTSSGVNAITNPSLFIMLQGVDFAGSQTLNAVSVGGFKAIRKRSVIGFEEGGIQYYCYEQQATPTQLTHVKNFFNTVEEAATSGGPDGPFYPHYVNLSKPRD